MARILLGVTASVAAVKVPELYQALRDAGHVIRIVATDRSCHFFDVQSPDGIPRTTRNPEICTLDADEWQGGGPEGRYVRGDAVLHIELRRWADLLLIAPIDANTLARFALGLCEGCLGSVWRAWDHNKPIILAPAMNTVMWNHPATCRHITTIGQDQGIDLTPGRESAPLIEAINNSRKGLSIVSPVNKVLACGDEGIGGMAGIAELVEAVNTSLSQR
jgi:phosphopantothenoylcysteine decarboxylase